MNLYNEIDPYAAQWLRNLIAGGHIAPGVVDERSVVALDPAECAGYTQCHFFAGIGGWSLALRLAGWPDDRPVWTGSCPCQPFSQAGAQRGSADERHLWPAFFRLIRECRPRRLFGEQVAGAAGLAWLDHVYADLESAGYAAAAANLCAAGAGAPHIRQRLYWVAQSDAGADGARRAQPELARPSVACDGVADAQDRGTIPRGLGGAVMAGGWREATKASKDAGRQHADTGSDLRHDSDDGSGRSDDGVADAEFGSAERHRLDLAGAARGAQGEAYERQRVRADARDGCDADGCGANGGMGDTSDAGPQRCDGPKIVELHRGQRTIRPTAETGLSCGGGSMGDTTGLRLDGLRERQPGGTQDERRMLESAGASPWSDVEWLACSDGKARPTEPGLFPLAHGVPARVGRLRAYGNAIVPQVAAAFIHAMKEIIDA